LCNPYITTTILEDTFGEQAPEVAGKYLTEYEKGRYRLKEEYRRWVSSYQVLPEQLQPRRRDYRVFLWEMISSGKRKPCSSVNLQLSLAEYIPKMYCSESEEWCSGWLHDLEVSATMEISFSHSCSHVELK